MKHVLDLDQFRLLVKSIQTFGQPVEAQPAWHVHAGWRTDGNVVIRPDGQECVPLTMKIYTDALERIKELEKHILKNVARYETRT